ncbi:hypothetical protein EPN90_04625, partial [Patescibacteria group bacterium]
KLYLALFGQFDFASPFFTLFVKLPGIAGDFLLAWTVWRFARRLAGEFPGLLAGFSILFHPAIFYVSAVWGQTDSLHSAFLVMAIDSLTAQKFPQSWIFWLLAVLSKLQSIALLPLLALRTWRERGALNLAATLLAAIFAGIALTLPFTLAHPLALWNSLLWNASRFPFLTLNAINIWWPLDRALGGFAPDTIYFLPDVSARLVGLALWALAIVLVLLRLRRNASGTETLAAAAALALAFFLFPTQMHERYLYPAVPFLLLLALKRRLGWLIFGAVSIIFMVNLTVVLPLFSRQAAMSGATPVWNAPGINIFWLALLVCFFLLVRMSREGRKEKIADKINA